DVGDDLGDVIGPIGGGMLWQAWGIVGLLGVRIALACLTEVYAALVLWRKRAPVAAALVAVALVTARAAGATHTSGTAPRRLDIPRLAPPAASAGTDAELAGDGRALDGLRLTDFRQ